jgi:hypothetical protein
VTKLDAFRALVLRAAKAMLTWGDQHAWLDAAFDEVWLPRHHKQPSRVTWPCVSEARGKEFGLEDGCGCRGCVERAALAYFTLAWERLGLLPTAVLVGAIHNQQRGKDRV